MKIEQFRCSKPLLPPQNEPHCEQQQEHDPVNNPERVQAHGHSGNDRRGQGNEMKENEQIQHAAITAFRMIL